MNNTSSIPNQQFLGVKKDQTPKVKLLLLDDEERILNSLKAIFRFKYDVYTATNGLDALKILKTHQDIAVVISDQRMPEMTGVDFLRKAKDISPHTVRILLTGFSDLQAIIGSINDGEVFRFLSKPWSNQEIQAVVEDAVSVFTEITAVVKPFDTSKVVSELQNTIIKSNIVLIKCKDKKLFELVQEGYKDSSTSFVHVTTQGQAVEFLEKNAVKVLVSSLDDTENSDDESTFLKLLKQELPELIAIGLVGQTNVDYQELIELINEAKLYRYLILPCKPERLHHQIKSAIDIANRIYANPVLLKQQSVVRRNLNESNRSPLDRGHPQALARGNPQALDRGHPQALARGNPQALVRGNPQALDRTSRPALEKNDPPTSISGGIFAKIRSLKSFWKR